MVWKYGATRFDLTSVQATYNAGSGKSGQHKLLYSASDSSVVPVYAVTNSSRDEMFKDLPAVGDPYSLDSTLGYAKLAQTLNPALRTLQIDPALMYVRVNSAADKFKDYYPSGAVYGYDPDRPDISGNFRSGDRHNREKLFTIKFGHITHRIGISINGGAHITSWAIDDTRRGYVDQQLLVTSQSFGRGIQMAHHIIEDPVAPDVIGYYHNPNQGGAYLVYQNNPGYEYSQGSPIVDIEGPFSTKNGIMIRMHCVPYEWAPDHDPNVNLGVIDDQHGGGPYNPIIWDGLQMIIELTIGYRDNPNIVGVRCYYYQPFNLLAGAGYNKSDVQAPTFHLNQAVPAGTEGFDLLFWNDPVAPLTTSLDSAPYNDMGHEYETNPTGVFKDFVSISGTPLIASGKGGLIAVKSSNGLAAGIYSVHKIAGGFVDRWNYTRQNGAGSAGVNGDNYCYTATDDLGNSLWSPAYKSRYAGWITRNTFFCIGHSNDVLEAFTQLANWGVGKNDDP